MSDASGPRLLVKARGLPARFALGGGGGEFAVEPLFHSIGVGSGGSRAAAAGASWYALKPTLPMDGENPWDLCHRLATQGNAAGLGDIEFAEPDLAQSWLVGRPRDLGPALAAGCGAPKPQNPRYPSVPSDPLWFRDATHGGFDAALAEVGDPGDAARVRIAHLDTGFDPGHATLPKHLDLVLQRNFVDAERPDDASDDSSGLVANLGHGTGTLGILAGTSLEAGKVLGVAPFASIVPIRVADSVVLFANSAVARALDYVHGLCADAATRVHVVTMSMGGLPSRAWAEAVNALYEAGVLVVAAAGNNFANLPTSQIVFPARFGRVVAACGAMCDGAPYADLAFDLMAGNYGPAEKMATAISGFTPNVPWAHVGCPSVVDGDGGGTSAATPQVAGAAALWIQKNRDAYERYPQGWMRVEAVRNALFDGAVADAARADHLGHGRLAAKASLAIAPAPAARLAKLDPDDIPFPFLATLLGQGVADAPARRAMFELEALQVAQMSGLEAELGRAGPTSEPRAIARTLDKLLAQPGLSQALRAALGDTQGTTRPQRGARTPDASQPTPPIPPASETADPVAALHLRLARTPVIPKPVERKLRVYAYDPSSSADLRTAGINDATVGVRWESLQPGPVGDYIEVVDYDPASGCCYAPIDLDDPRLLAQNGFPPSEGNPQFHQQMAYAVAMGTIAHFERALGRRALWSPRPRRDVKGNIVGQDYVQRLRIYPHALRAANSFYSSERKALLLGYFEAKASDTGAVLPGGRVFCAVSHDIVAHETAHALLDGLHRRYQEATNPDVLAFHEAFADIVALFQHFTIPEALFQQVRQTRGQFEGESLLGRLALQFGEATLGKDQALRDAVGHEVDGVWKAAEPSTADYGKDTEPHALGGVLVSAVFAAFIALYEAQTADLIRLATRGTGILPPGEISYDLAQRLSIEAAKLARQMLQMCIRALDYCPPVDITFGEYLRALVTADRDLVPDDPRGYRVALVKAFRERGIFPPGVRSLSTGSLVWEAPPLGFDAESLDAILKDLDLTWDMSIDRSKAFEISERNGYKFWAWLMDAKQADQLAALGFERKVGKTTIQGVPGELRPIEIHSVRPARRVGPDGQSSATLVVEITQTFRHAASSSGRSRGGCTLLIDVDQIEAKYFIGKRLAKIVGRLREASAEPVEAVAALRANYYAHDEVNREPFALLHGPH